MSGSNPAPSGGQQGGNVWVNGWGTLIQFLGGIQQTLASISKSLSAVVFGLTANNTFTGDNTFEGTTVFDGSTTFVGGATFKPPPEIFAGDVGAGTFQPAGLLSAQTSNSGVGNGANTSDDILYTFSIPANSLDQVGRGIRISSFGSFGATTNDKRIQMLINATVVFGSGTLTNNAGWWNLRAEFYKSGANAQVGSTVLVPNAALPLAVLILNSATDTAPITITITGASQTSGVANDVTANGLTVEFLN